MRPVWLRFCFNGSHSVRDTLAAYLYDLLSIGVTGFRIDAAKRMSSENGETRPAHGDGGLGCGEQHAERTLAAVQPPSLG